MVRGLRLGLALTLSLLSMGGAARAATLLEWSPIPAFDLQPPYGLAVDVASVSCPTASFCAAVDAKGEVLTSTDPTGDFPAWTRRLA